MALICKEYIFSQNGLSICVGLQFEKDIVYGVKGDNRLLNREKIENSKNQWGD